MLKAPWVHVSYKYRVSEKAARIGWVPVTCRTVCVSVCIK